MDDNQREETQEDRSTEGQESEILVFKFWCSLIGRMAEIDVIEATPEEWNKAPESLDSAWLARPGTRGNIIAVRHRI